MGLYFLWNGATLRQVEAWKRSIHLDENGLIDLIEVAWRPLASAVLVQEKLANTGRRTTASGTASNAA